MGDWPRLVNLRRCVRGTIVDSGEDTNTTVALFNSSPAPELLLVWQYSDQSAEDQLGFSYQQGMLGLAPGGTIQQVMPTDGIPPGILVSGDQATAFNSDWLNPTIKVNSAWPATFPFAVLPPGWALVVQNPNNPTDSITISFYWEAILSEYFDRMHSALCVELELQEDSES